MTPPLGTPVLLLCISLLMGAIATAQPVTTQRTDYPSAVGARGIVVADLNRDGWMDVATANEGPHGVAILMNGGRNGGFSHTFVPLTGGPFDLAAGDLNEDGILDLAVANADAHTIDVLLGRAEGGFAPAVSIAVHSNPRAITTADMDNDGNVDLVFTLYQTNRVQVLHGDGRGGVAARLPAVAVGPQPQGVVAVDLNLDGRKDLAVANNGSTSMTILHQQGDGSFARSDLAGPNRLNVLASADFNDDGKPDIAAVSTPSSVVDVYLGGAGIVRYATSIPTGANPRGVAAADINQDGAADIVTGNRGSGTISVLLGNGDGTFAAAAEFAAGTASRAVAVADFDNDGRIDIAAGNEDAPSLTVLNNSTALVRAGFAFSRQMRGAPNSTFSGASTVAIADFDHDGKTDTLTHRWPRGLLVLLGNGRHVELLSDRSFGDIEAADMNGDGHDDIVTLLPGPTLSSGDVVWVVPGDGTGQFGPPNGTSTNVYGMRLVIADLNRDGKRDVLGFGHSLADYDRGAVQPLLGGGNGSFTFLPAFVLGGNLSAFAVGDINRDGAADFAAAYRYPAAVDVYRGQGDGNFSVTANVAFPQWSYVVSLDIGDVNTDGRLDLVATSSVFQSDHFDFQLAVVAGGSSGMAEPAYAPGPKLFEGQGQARLVDLNMDGRLDLMTPTGDLMPGDGNGAFGEIQGFALEHALDLKFGDFNGDGLVDMAHGRSLGEVALILNRRQETNTPPTVDAGRDATFPYQSQFGDDELAVFGTGVDPDLHRLVYQWYGPAGEPVWPSYDDGWMELHNLAPGRYTFRLRASDGRGGVGEDPRDITILPLKEVVVHFPDEFFKGTWQKVADPSAASGVRAYDQNLGHAKVTTPVASPSSFTFVSFIADPTQEYKLWVRLKAEGDSWANDSLWLQFSGAVDAAGNPVAPIHTTSGIEVNLEECSGCGVSGWGWRDEAWGRPNAIGTVTLRFPTGGRQSIRLQTREDGVSIDQIVLSAETYRTTRPGAVKNDAVILPRTIFW
jgi:hypothetical protein